MLGIRLLFIAIVASLIMLVSFSCVTSNPDYTTPEGLSSLIKNPEGDYILIDVRTAEEYRTGYIPSAINIPYTDILEQIPTTDKSRLIIVYCQSGIRSAKAQTTLEEAGYNNVYNFGGVGEWNGTLKTETAAD
jgi:rhodanese-related sulfurtransferase